MIAVKQGAAGYYNIEEKVIIKSNGMTKATANDRELQQKIEEYGDMLFKLSFVRLQNIQDAEDVVQDVFYQYLKHLQDFQSPEHEKAWLLKTTVNACRKVWRSAWRRHQADVRPAQDGDEALDGCGRGMAAGSYDVAPGMSEPEETAVRREESTRLMEAVLSLPPRYRDVIHLFYYEDFSVKDIARITSRRESTVTSQLTRGRELLRKTLKGEYDFG